MKIRARLRVNPIVVFLYWLPAHFFLFIARFFPLQNKIVFDNFRGKGLGDDPKYILLQLIKNKVNAKYIWLLNDFAEDMPVEVKKIKYGSWLATFHYLTAKVWIDNVKSSPKPPKRKGQFYLQTWHGSFANKMVEEDAKDYLCEEYIKASQEDSSKIDLMYSNNDFKINLFKNSFWYKGPVIKSDSPQLSVLINPPPNLKKHLFSQFNIHQQSKIVLYAPTFRRKLHSDTYIWNYQKILKALEQTFNSEFTLLIRFHPNVNNSKVASIFNKNCINVTDYPDMDELMAISDVMITDFSGVAFDMALTRKPVFIFAKDYDDYVLNDRPQYFPQNELPFTLAKTELELQQNIQSFHNQSYQNKINHFFKRIGMEERGFGAKNIANIIMERLAK